MMSKLRLIFSPKDFPWLSAPLDYKPFPRDCTEYHPCNDVSLFWTVFDIRVTPTMDFEVCSVRNHGRIQDFIKRGAVSWDESLLGIWRQLLHQKFFKMCILIILKYWRHLDCILGRFQLLILNSSLVPCYSPPLVSEYEEHIEAWEWDSWWLENGVIMMLSWCEWEENGY